MVSETAAEGQERSPAASLGPLAVEYEGTKTAIPRTADYQETLALIKISVEHLSCIPTSMFVLSTTTLPGHPGENVVVNEPVWQTVVFSAYFTSVSVNISTAMRREFDDAPRLRPRRQLEPRRGASPDPVGAYMKYAQQEQKAPEQLYNVAVFGTPNFNLITTPWRIIAGDQDPRPAEWGNLAGKIACAVAVRCREAVNATRSHVGIQIGIVSQAYGTMTLKQAVHVIMALLVVIWSAFNIVTFCICWLDAYRWHSQAALSVQFLHQFSLLICNVSTGVFVLLTPGQSWFLRVTLLAQMLSNLFAMR
ncbi:unnamed protein product [Peniophora sp. CBMAI 1063]|nr:unnamed protein product [Peniophora sp. CBMAI 1063]